MEAVGKNHYKTMKRWFIKVCVETIVMLPFIAYTIFVIESGQNYRLTGLACFLIGGTTTYIMKDVEKWLFSEDKPKANG